MNTNPSKSNSLHLLWADCMPVSVLGSLSTLNHFGQCRGYYCFVVVKDFIYLFLEREGREKERKRNISVPEIYRLVAFCTPPTGDLVP